MEYLILYLAWGIPIAILTRLAMTENTRRGWLFIWFVWPLWPLWALSALHMVVLRVLAWYQSRRCYHCGWIGNNKPETWIEHSKTCPKHPLVIENRRYRDALEEIRTGHPGPVASADPWTDYIRRGQALQRPIDIANKALEGENDKVDLPTV